MNKFDTIRSKHMDELTTQMKVVTEQVADLTTTVDLLSKFVDLERFNRDKISGMANIPEDAIHELEARREEVRARFHDPEYRELLDTMIAESNSAERSRMLHEFFSMKV